MSAAVQSRSYCLDTHAHSLVSGHAYSTIAEMSAAAAGKGLELLAVTEHGPGTRGSCVDYYFQNLRILPREMNGVRMLFGAEVSILDFAGHLDLDDRTLQQLDIVIASVHNETSFRPGTMACNTEAVLRAMENPNVCILGHPDDSRYPLDYETILKTAGEKRILPELNNSSLDPRGWRLNARENCITILRLCRRMGIPISLGSDAHYAGDVGNFSRLLPLLAETDFPDELIVNTSVEKLLQWLEARRSAAGISAG